MQNFLRLSLISLATALLLSACRADENSDANSTAIITTVGQAILAAEANGTIPKLNHDDTIAGPDTDANGIRDDIDAYIATLPYTEVQKKAVQQDARALTATLTVDKTNNAAITAANATLSRSIACLHHQFSPESNDASKISANNEKMIVNTKNRFLEYEKFNSALSGTTWSSPDRETSCDN